MQDYWLQKLLN